MNKVFLRFLVESWQLLKKKEKKRRNESFESNDLSDYFISIILELPHKGKDVQKGVSVKHL